MTHTLRILKAGDVADALAGQELAIIEVVRRAYEDHIQGKSELPHSVFLRFPHDKRSRIIALPAYLGGTFDLAGIKWIGSFPGNHDHNLPRASAVLIFNSVETGLPEAIVEGSLISAARTAASAALGAGYLHADPAPTTVGCIGAGLINSEIIRFLLARYPGITNLVVCDTHEAQAHRFAQHWQDRAALTVQVVAQPTDVLQRSLLVSFATTASEPHIADLSMCAPGSTLLHISLRDIAASAILQCDNIVDDIDHAVRAQTSLHLAAETVQHRDFIRCTLADITSGRAPARRSPEDIVVFSPFGLGVLDLAVGQMVLEHAAAAGAGLAIDDFLPL